MDLHTPARPFKWTVLLVASLAVSVVPRVAAAQQSREGPPVQVEAKPRLVSVGTPVTIAGTTFVDGKRLQVGITVQPPEKAAPIKLTATAHATEGTFEGTFSVTFKETKAPGDYQVTAVSPDGRGTGKTTFRVLTAGGLATDALKTLGDAITVATSALDGAVKHTQPLPSSPDAQAVMKNLEAIRSALAKADEQRGKMGKGVDAVADLASKDPEVRQAVEPDFRALGEWSDATQQELARIRERLKSAPTPVSLCDRIELANDGLTALSLVMVFTGRAGAIASVLPVKTGYAILLNLLQNNVLPQRINAIKGLSDDAKFALTEIIKAEVLLLQGVGSSLDLIGTVGRGGVGLANDTAGFLLNKLFPMHCSKFSGPITSDFEVTFLHNGDMWAHYTVRLEGRLVLRYLKNATVGQPIRLTGELEGNATNFTFDEDVFLIDDNLQRAVVRRRGGRIFLRKRITPQLWGNSTNDPVGFGLFARMATPAYFYIPVEGELVENRIVLKVLEASVDFGDDAVKNRLILIYTALIIPIPVIETFDFPIQKAQFILSRGMEHTPDFTIETVGGQQVIERTFTRHESPGNTRVRFVVSVKATNPPPQ